MKLQNVRSYDNASHLGRATKELQAQSAKSETGAVCAIKRGSYWHYVSEDDAAMMLHTSERFVVVYCASN